MATQGDVECFSLGTARNLHTSPIFQFFTFICNTKEKLKNHFRLQTFLLLHEKEKLHRRRMNTRKIALEESFSFFPSLLFMSWKIPRTKKILAESFSCSSTLCRALNEQNSLYSRVGSYRGRKRSYEQTFFNVETLEEEKMFFKLQQQRTAKFFQEISFFKQTKKFCFGFCVDAFFIFKSFP